MVDLYSQIVMSHKIQAILERVRRYQLPIWQYQSLEILNPYRLASIGYIPVDRNTLQCSICLKQVDISEERQVEASKLQEQLRQHDQNCIYDKEEGTLIDKEQLYLSIEEVSTELNERSTSQRYPVMKASSIWKYTESNQYMLKKVMKLYKIQTEQINTTFFLRLFGWFFNKDQNHLDCLSCYFCGRSLALSHFASTPNPIQDQKLEESTDLSQLFDPIEQHRYFCMWAGKDQNWLVLLQDLEDKFSEYMSFKLKMQPLSTKKMKVHIDKYLQSFSEKIEASVVKLKQVGQQFGKVCDYLSKQKEAEVSPEQMENDKKRIRSIEEAMEEAAQTMKSNLHPSKKIKIN